MRDHTVAGLERPRRLDRRADLDDFARDVVAQDVRVPQPEPARGLDLPVHRVHGHGVVLDDDLVSADLRGKRAGSDLQSCLFRRYPCGVVDQLHRRRTVTCCGLERRAVGQRRGVRERSDAWWSRRACIRNCLGLLETRDPGVVVLVIPDTRAVVRRQAKFD